MYARIFLNILKTYVESGPSFINEKILLKRKILLAVKNNNWSKKLNCEVEKIIAPAITTNDANNDRNFPIWETVCSL